VGWPSQSSPIATNSAKIPAQAKGERPSGFVELLAGGSGVATSCLVEVESPRGAKLKLKLKGIQTSQLAELIRAFADA
jgi:hypothetical protein